MFSLIDIAHRLQMPRKAPYDYRIINYAEIDPYQIPRLVSGYQVAVKLDPAALVHYGILIRERLDRLIPLLPDLKATIIIFGR